MIDLDRLVHEPARLVILALLSGLDEASFVYLQRESGLTRGNLSSHLSTLEEAGYITIEKTFRNKIPVTIARLTNSGRKALDCYSASVKGMLRWER
jgi:DNA-binding MarR family transcriptional regulator